MRLHLSWRLPLALGLMLAVPSVETRGAERLADVNLAGASLAVRPLVDAFGVSVTVTGPNGLALTRAFGPAEAAALELAGPDGALADGLYRYEVTLAARPEHGLRGSDEQGAAARGVRPPRVQQGSFRVMGGAPVPGDAPEASAARPQPGASRATRDQVIPDDLIVQGSFCVGFDCVNNETFGHDTVRLKENNTRIQFDDTSASPYATNNWQIRANSSASGGESFLGFVDQGASQTSENGTLVFGVEAGAGANALWVDSGGRLGLGTGTPLLDVHVKTPNTPALRMEQDNSGGFTAQTWDVAANEANFFVRDVTGGARLPFRIRPGAPTSSIDIAADGDIGIGTASPSAPLHVRRSNATAKLVVEETGTPVIARNVLQLINNGAPTLRFDNTANGQLWSFGQLAGSNFFFGATPGQALAVQIDTAGNLTTTGTVNGVSDRDAKQDIVLVDPQSVLSKVAAMPISTWRFKQARELHMGPMAQDFAAAFGLGVDDRHIALGDLGGVALAAIQALNETVASKDQRLFALERQNAELARQNAGLAERLAALEAALHPGR